ncbi:MAG TPA: polysaccharide biosynthesis tyrosine autokinase [Microvirga sp.]|nr:polysaccharide biosynthesis tyrosine autokinase [Microvirga sp.]
MLKVVRPDPIEPASQRAAAGGVEDGQIDLSYVLGFLRRQWAVILACLLATLALALVYLFVTPPRYTGKALLMLDTRRLQLFQQQSVLSEVSFDAPAVESQLELLKSENVALSVIDSLKLKDDPEFTGEVQSFVGALIREAWKVVDWGVLDADSVLSHEQVARRALRHFKKNLYIQRVGRTYVIEIGFRSLDPAKAAKIANAVADAYILDQLQAKYKATRRAGAWLQERLAELRGEAVAADRAAQDYKVKHNIVDAGGRLVNEQQLAEVSSQLVQARAHTAEAKARLDRIQEIGESGLKDATVADSLRNEVINRLRQQYLETSKREAEHSVRYGRDHLAAVNLRKEMQQIERVMSEELKRIAEVYRSDYEIARSREESLQASLEELTRQSADTRQAQVSLRVLESSSQAYRALYDSFLQRFMETTQQQSFPNTEARVITEATGAEKTHPKVAVVLGLGGLFGFLFGCGAAFARERLDRVFRTPRQVEQTIGVECLGVLPAVQVKDPVRPPAGEEPADGGLLGGRLIARDLGIARHVVVAPFSRFTETVRGIKVAADTSAPAHGTRVVGTVSAVPAEGKSTVSANLAQLMAHTGNRTLLIDGDLRNPSLTRRMAPEAEHGILDFLEDRAGLGDLVWRDPITGLEFLPAVIRTPIAHTSELLSSPGMKRLLAVAREEYDYVVVDFPPLAPVVDAKAAGHLVDAFLLVIEWGRTSPEVIAETLGSAEVVQSKLLGAVLNRANPTALKRIEAYKGRSYQNYYSSYVSSE